MFVCMRPENVEFVPSSLAVNAPVEANRYSTSTVQWRGAMRIRRLAVVAMAWLSCVSASWFAAERMFVAAADEPASFAELLVETPADPMLKSLAKLEKEVRLQSRLAQAEEALEQLRELPVEKLQEFQAVANREHAQALERWEAVEELLAGQNTIAHEQLVRAASFIMETTESGNTCRTTLEAIKARAEAAFRKRYASEDLSDPSARHARYQQWIASPEGREFEREKTEGNEQLRRELQGARKRSNEDAPILSRLVQKVRIDVTYELGFWARVVRETEKETARRRGGQGTEPEEPRPLEEEATPLRLQADVPEAEAKTGETKAIWFSVVGGRAPYRIHSYVPETNGFIELEFENPQPFMLPHRLVKAGSHTVHVQAVDGDASTSKVSFEIRVTDDGIASTEKPSPAPGGAPEKSATSPPSAKNTWPPLSGRFDARLWGPAYTNPGLPQPVCRNREDNFYTPLIVTISRSGQISGKANYTFPESKYAPKAPDSTVEWDCHVKFDLAGRFDPQTGKTTLRLRQGGRSLKQIKSDGDVFEYRTEYETTLNGWRIHGPKDTMLANSPYVRGLQNSQDRAHVPRTLAASNGEARFQQDGFLGVRGLDDGDAHVEHTIARHEEITTGRRSNKVKDRTESAQRMVEQTGPVTWFLELLHRTDDDPEEPELLALLVFPRPPIPMVQGSTRQFLAKGIFKDNLFTVKDLTFEATWRQTKGLLPATNDAGTVTKGLYWLNSSDTQYVRAGIRQGDEWVSDTVPVTAALK